MACTASYTRRFFRDHYICNYFNFNPVKRHVMYVENKSNNYLVTSINFYWYLNFCILFSKILRWGGKRANKRSYNIKLKKIKAWWDCLQTLHWVYFGLFTQFMAESFVNIYRSRHNTIHGAIRYYYHPFQHNYIV